MADRRPTADVTSRDWRARAAIGARRGVLAGVYFFVIYFVIDSIQHRRSYLAEAPFTVAIAMIVGFVIAGAVLLIGVPSVKSTSRAAGLGILTAYPAMTGFMIASAGWSSVVFIGAF